jgi:hypothetical protein
MSDDLVERHPANRGKGRGVRWIREHLDHQGDSCLPWPFALDDKGYGQVGYNGKVYKASRLMCIFKHGDPPSDAHHAAHSCGNGHLACTSPNHVFWRTPLENRLESNGHGTGKGPVPRRLTIDKVAEIRASSKSYAEMAADYGVHADTIGKIFRGETWKKPRSSLTGDQVRKIKELNATGMRAADIARAVGVKYGSVLRMRSTQAFRGE